MSVTETEMIRRLQATSDLKGVVRTLKTLAAAALRPLEAAVTALENYQRAVRLGLTCCLREIGTEHPGLKVPIKGPSVLLAFGSDLGMVGSFNEALAAFVRTGFASYGQGARLWVVGAKLAEIFSWVGMECASVKEVPESVETVGELLGRIILDLETEREKRGMASLILVYNRLGTDGRSDIVTRKLLPMDKDWLQSVTSTPWPTRRIPQPIPAETTLLPILIREYLFAGLFEACVDSMAGENMSRLKAMERAEKNVDELLEDLSLGKNRLRQESISQELLELMSAFEAVVKKKRTIGSAFKKPLSRIE